MVKENLEIYVKTYYSSRNTLDEELKIYNKDPDAVVEGFIDQLNKTINLSFEFISESLHADESMKIEIQKILDHYYENNSNNITIDQNMIDNCIQALISLT